jgi:hypothetical protein
MLGDFKNLENALDDFILKIKEFEKTKNDFLKKDIRAFFNKINHLSKILLDTTKIDASNILNALDLYLAENSEIKYKNLIHLCLKLKEDILEL